MNKVRSQMIVVAVLVCLFAVGMAGLLNFFKYRSTSDRLIKDRLVVTGTGIENSIRSSLALGMQFSDLGTLPETLERERATDELIRTVEVFDTDGKSLYSTDRLRAVRGVRPEWLAEAKDAGGEQWMVKNGANSAVGVPIKNSFGLVIGHVALRFDDAQLRESTMAVARELALISLVVFVVAAVLSSLALIAVMNRMAKDLKLVEQSLTRGAEGAQAEAPAIRGPFAKPLLRFFDSARSAESQIAALRARLGQGGRP
jgi:hypothetical protein